MYIIFTKKVQPFSNKQSLLQSWLNSSPMLDLEHSKVFFARNPIKNGPIPSQFSSNTHGQWLLFEHAANASDLLSYFSYWSYDSWFITSNEPFGAFILSRPAFHGIWTPSFFAKWGARQFVGLIISEKIQKIYQPCSTLYL